MRRTNGGAARPLALSRSGGGEDSTDRRAERPAPDPVPSAALARITVLPVTLGDEATNFAGSGEGAAMVRMAGSIPARSVSARVLESSGADVVLLDARACRPTMAYRAVARLRNAGWNRGILLLIDPDQLAMVPVASAIGASDFALSTAPADELHARLRRTSPRAFGPVPEASPAKAGIQLLWRTQQVSFEGTTISLTRREIQLLSVLMEHGREVMTSGDLARLAWGKGRGPGGALAAAYVCSLRKKLAWFGGRFGIQTVRGVGYRFVV